MVRFENVLIFITLFSLTGCQNEDNKELTDEKAGIEYYKKGDYEKSLSFLKKAADPGSIKASRYLGKMYQYGKGVDKDYTLSFKWYLNAAEKGDKESSGMVGASYYFGQGIKQDYKESFRWLLKASEKIDEKKTN